MLPPINHSTPASVHCTVLVHFRILYIYISFIPGRSWNLNPNIVASFEHGCQPHSNMTFEGYKKITCNNITYLDDIKAHVNYMFATSTIVTCPWITFQGVGQIATIEVMVPQIIMAPPDTLFDRIWLVVFQICVQFLQLQQTGRQTKSHHIHSQHRKHAHCMIIILSYNYSCTSYLLTYSITTPHSRNPPHMHGDVAAESDKWELSDKIKTLNSKLEE